jgi:hypothetical protein
VAQYVRIRPQAQSSMTRWLDPVRAYLYHRPRVSAAVPMPSGIIRMTLSTRTRPGHCGGAGAGADWEAA